MGSKAQRWRRLAGIVALFALPLVILAAWLALSLWIPLFPRDLGRRWTEEFLRALLVGYAAMLGLAGLGIALFGGALIRARRAGRRCPNMVAKGLLLCVSSLFALGLAEVASAAWLTWSHRLPALPTRLLEPMAGTASIVVIGGSSALGYPYQPWISPGQIVAWQLQQANPRLRYRLEIRAREGATLERMHQELAGLRERPDAIIIYSGHNEFQSRYEGSRDAGLDEVPRGSWLRRLYRWSFASPLCRVVYETISKNRLGGPPPPIRWHRLIDPPMLTPSEREAILSDFRRRLKAIVAYCERIGALPILVIPPANDAGFDPSRSVLPEPISEAERADLDREYWAARAAEQDDPARSMATYRSILDRHPQFAEIHYRLARLLERSGEIDQAEIHFVAARDGDGYPIRCPSDFQAVYRELASQSESLLIDGPALLRAASPSGLRDDFLFHDAHHPTLGGQIAIAQAVLDGLLNRRALGLPDDEAWPTIDPIACAEQFGMDATKWASVCARSATFYRDYAPDRFDPAMRLAKQRGFELARLRVLAGEPPNQLGVPGLGVPPAPNREGDWWEPFQIRESPLEADQRFSKPGEEPS